MRPRGPSARTPGAQGARARVPSPRLRSLPSSPCLPGSRPVPRQRVPHTPGAERGAETSGRRTSAGERSLPAAALGPRPRLARPAAAATVSCSSGGAGAQPGGRGARG